MKQKRFIAVALIFMFLINFVPFYKVYATNDSALKVGVYTQDGVIYQSLNVEFIQGDTPYSVLTRLVSNVKSTGSGESVYVSSINGVAEFQNGPLSGWVYAVNGVKPNVGAGSYYLKPGDKLVWHYTLDLGEDIYKGINKLEAYINANPPAPPVEEKPIPPVEEKPVTPPSQKPEKPSEKPSKPNEDNANINKPVEEKPASEGKDEESNEVKDNEAIDKDKEQALNKDNESLANNIDEILLSAKKAYTDELNSSWEAIALVKLGGKVSEEYIDNLLAEVKENKGLYNKVTELEKNIILLNILGYDVTNIEGINLLETLLTSEVEKQGSNGVIFAIIALNSIDEKVMENFLSKEVSIELLTKDKLIDILLSYQNEDGGFPLVKGEESDLDITAMALQALGGAKVKMDEKIEKSIDYLKNAEFKNSEAIAQTIIACSYLGKNPEDFYGRNLIEELLKYKQEDNTFKHIVGSNQDDDKMATEQGILALISYENYKSDKENIYSGKVKANEIQTAIEKDKNISGEKENKGESKTSKITIIVAIIGLALISGTFLYKKGKKN